MIKYAPTFVAGALCFVGLGLDIDIYIQQVQ
jgi:hypothetical protein